jgi:predicted metal-dependent hydrolase
VPVPPSIAAAWSAELTYALDRPTEVSFGRARRNVIVVRTIDDTLTVRLNEHFAEAPLDVREALTAWLRSGKRARAACRRLDGWIDELAKRLGPPARRRVSVRPRGEHHDLSELATSLLREEFAGELSSDFADRITWGRRGTRPARTSLQLGSYDPEQDLVRVHPVLDQAAVPRSFVRYVLFHELLHAVIDREVGPRPEGGSRRRRRPHHGRRFREREQRYAGFARAMEWQEEHLAALFRSARTGKPLRLSASERARAAATGAVRLAQGWLFPDALRPEGR